MIPKYFRCGDPSQKCPLSVSKEILKEDPKWSCPCQNPNCTDSREPISFFSVHKPWFFGGATVVLLLMLFLLMSGRDSCVTKLQNFQARLESKNKQLSALEVASSNLPSGVTASEREIASLESQVSRYKTSAVSALGSENSDDIRSALDENGRIASAVKLLSESDKPVSGSGVRNAEAGFLAAKLQALMGEVEEQYEWAETECPGHAADFGELIASVGASLSKARRLASPSGSDNHKMESTLVARLSAMSDQLGDIRSKLEAFVPPIPQPTVPFERKEANLLVSAAPCLADSLIGPLASAWANTSVINSVEQKLFIDGGEGKKIIIESNTSDQGFKLLASGDIDLFIADRSPTPNELSLFGPNFKETRSVADVIAMNALTLLVHPENQQSTYEVGRPHSLKIAAGSIGTMVRRKAEEFGVILATSSDLYGEAAAMQDVNMLAYSLYHLEGANLRAKRLAVKPSTESPALNPSPFTIATEDYRYSYRIMSWNPPKANQLALDFNTFITSDAGQEIVSQQGFIDRRLRPTTGDIDPRILAALGAALGVDSISSAQRLSTNIRFMVGDSQLDVKAQSDIERITRIAASDFSDHTVVILGFTDSTGGPAINQPLSKRRAEVVAEELRRFRVNTRSEGLGDSIPIDSNETDAGKARNRRAEVWVVKP